MTLEALRRLVNMINQRYLENMSEENKPLEQEELQGQDPMEAERLTDAEPNADEMAPETDTPVAGEPTPEQRLAELQDAHLRLMAEYDNYRKRTLKEKSDLIRSGGEKVLKDLLPVVDDLDIALANIDTANDIDAIREGIRLIYGKFMDYLSRQGVRPIETTGVPFDAELHEAIATFPAGEPEQVGQVIDCVKRGYTLHDKVLRHASVVVGQ